MYCPFTAGLDALFIVVIHCLSVFVWEGSGVGFFCFCFFFFLLAFILSVMKIWRAGGEVLVLGEQVQAPPGLLLRSQWKKKCTSAL